MFDVGGSWWEKCCRCPDFIKCFLVAVVLLQEWDHCSAEGLQLRHSGLVRGETVSCRGGRTKVIKGQRTLWVRWQTHGSLCVCAGFGGVMSNKEGDYLKERRCAAALILDSFSCVFSRVSFTVGSVGTKGRWWPAWGPCVFSDQSCNLIGVTVGLLHRTTQTCKMNVFRHVYCKNPLLCTMAPFASPPSRNSGCDLSMSFFNIRLKKKKRVVFFSVDAGSAHPVLLITLTKKFPFREPQKIEP